MKCADCPIHPRAFCARSSRGELDRLDALKTYRSFRAGETILRSGDVPSFVASVVEGAVTLTRRLEDGRTQVVGLLLPPDFIGHPGRGRSECDVIAASDILLCSFDPETFGSILREMPHVSAQMIHMAIRDLDAARRWMLLLGRKTAGEKVATFIDMVVRRKYANRGDVTDMEMLLPLSRGDIASYLGLTLETLSRQIASLKSAGILEFVDKRRFRVIDLEGLRRATGDDDDGGLPG
jgi:CRP/FNR family transcriptional regulator